MKLARGAPLERACKVVQGGGRTEVVGPFTKTREVVGGYTLVKAADPDQAANLARECPILQRGGDVEVRPVMTIEGLPRK